MKKFILSMMIMTMTIVGTITANGATKTDKNFRRGKAVCTAMHCKHNHKAEGRTHRAWTKPHKHKFNRKNECVKCHLTKREIKKMMRKHDRHAHRNHGVCAPRPVMHRR